MWLADGWKDYEVIDCSKGEKIRALGRLSSGASGSSGDLGYPKETQRLEEDERTLSSQQQRRR